MDRKKSNEKKCLNDILDKYDKVIIPDIQRDYVMGSGGEKLHNLLKKMNEKAVAIKDGKDVFFDFSCLIVHEDNENGILYIYDGQQRLATLIYLAAYLLVTVESATNREKGVIGKNIAKFKFAGRDRANDFLKAILKKENIMDTEYSSKYIVDFTTFSIHNLIESIIDTKKNYKAINAEFLINKVLFNYVTIKDINDVQQFFMDLNSGVKLKEYEIYKAKLNDKVCRIRKEYNHQECKDNIDEYSECLSKWSLKLDNHWLRFFEHCIREGDSVNEEELEIRFIRYCIKMIYIENNGYKDVEKIDFTRVEKIKKEDVKRIYYILDNLNLNENEDNNIFNYAWTEKKHTDIRGAYWNLKFSNYSLLLKKFIESLKEDKYSELHIRDITLWCYLTNLKSVNDEYLRFIKKMLNNNRICNNIAWYDSSSLYFSRYLTYVVPDYYLDFKGAEFKKDDSKDTYLYELLKLNKEVILIDKKMRQVFSIINERGNEYVAIKSVLDFEKIKYDSVEIEDIKKLEDMPMLNGLIHNFWDCKNNKLILDFVSLQNKIEKKLGDIYRRLACYYLSPNSNLGKKLHIRDIMMEIDCVKWSNADVKWSDNDVIKYQSESNVKIICQNLIDFFTYDEWNNDISEEKNLMKKWLTYKDDDYQVVYNSYKNCFTEECLSNYFEEWLNQKNENCIAIVYLFIWGNLSTKGWYDDQSHTFRYSSDQSISAKVYPWYNRCPVYSKGVLASNDWSRIKYNPYNDKQIFLYIKGSKW